MGRVIALDDTDSGISMLTESWRSTSYSPSCLEALYRLNSGMPFENEVFIVSKCGPKVEARTRSWFHNTQFWTRTRIGPDHLFVVRERGDKAAVAERLSLTHFVDDRVGVLLAMSSVPYRYVFGPAEPPQVPPGVRWVRDWGELEDRLHRDQPGR
ncbi:hypothetical protein [Terrabacter sp. Root181]|uniref:hypothetical protein n=1 Tax=Terrabacter sp. Root181 TaxID=1736484 RepID=UPI0012F87595|nr:hypothetical protein [Terrabacter sp. Root181]